MSTPELFSLLVLGTAVFLNNHGAFIYKRVVNRVVSYLQSFWYQHQSYFCLVQRRLEQTLCSAGCKGTMKTLVIGLGGVTNGGKSTLAGKLKKLLPSCTIISQDDFFKPESEVAKDDRGFLQYDVLDALYMETMVASIRSWMTKPEDSALPRPPNNTHDDQTGAKDIRVLIIEGFLLFNYKPLSDIWDKKYFLTIPYEECKRRRSNRIYSPPDPPGYFDGHVWPMYQKHRREMEENEASIVYLDGTKPQEDLCSRIYNDIMQELEKTSEQGIIMHA